MLILLTCVCKETSDVDSTFAGVVVCTTDIQKLCTHRKNQNLMQINDIIINENIDYVASSIE